MADYVSALLAYRELTSGATELSTVFERACAPTLVKVTGTDRHSSFVLSPSDGIAYDKPMSDADPTDFSEALNLSRDGWNAAMNLRFVHATRDEVRAEIVIGPQHLQPYGVVHGGVYAGIVETLASSGAALDAMERGYSVVGLDNQTSFLRATRGGTLHATATPLARGKRSQLWEGRIVDDAGRLVATGRVRLLCLEPGATLAGEAVALKG